MLAGTGVLMAVRHGAPFRRPGAWFTAKPLATARPTERPPRAAACPVVTVKERRHPCANTGRAKIFR